MKSIIIGSGEVGSSLYEVLSKHYEVKTYDKFKDHKTISGQFEILHICFPYGTTFIKEVKSYQKLYKPKFTVIHSTVPVGTSRKCGAMHSPIRGIYPDMVKALLVFPKFIGGKQASQVADYFRRAKFKVILCDEPEATELGKLLDTEYYRACIEFTLKAKKYCDKYKVNFHEAYTLFNQTYNESFAKLDHSEFIRPILQPIMKEIGGHCVVPNSKLI
ncbi:MAG: hypothetical protein ACYC5G_00410 [Candidatus Doudnabacteria bacterium]